MTALGAEPAVGRVDGAPLIGRRFQLAELLGALEEARAGHGRLLLLSGDAGIGKTRLARTVADVADAAGMPVAWGSCGEVGGAPPFWPWSQVLGAEVAARVALAPGGQAIPGARSALFDWVLAGLRERSAQAGLLVVLDDLHAADHASLRLLQHVARDLSDSRVLVVATYRDQHARTSPTIHQTISTLARQGRRMTLTGLDEDSVATLLEHTMGSVPLPELARHVHHSTDGNAFFVGEIGRLLAAPIAVVDPHHPVMPVPDDVHAVVRARLEPLDAAVREVLAIASVLGQEFGAAVLASVLHRSVDAVLELLAEGQRLDVVQEIGPGFFRFSHALVRDAIYDGLRPSECVSLHRRAAEALAASAARPTIENPSELAHHYFCAARGGEGTEAVRWCGLAGDHAMEALAFEEAATLYGRALEALALCIPVDEDRRFELLLALAAAQQRAGDLPLARLTHQRAVKSARALGAPELLARALIASESMADPDDGSGEPLLEEALAALPPGDSASRARLLLLFARRLGMQGAVTSEGRRRGQQRATDLAREGVAMARRVGEPETLRAVLSDWHTTASTSYDASEERLATAGELLQLAGEGADAHGRVLARQRRAYDLYVLGDIAAVAAELDQAAAEAEVLRQPFLVRGVVMQQAGLALLRGELDVAEHHARRARDIGRRAELPDENGASATQLGELHRHRGEWSELEDLLRPLGDGVHAGSVRARLAIAAAHGGDRAEAHAVLLETVAHLPEPGVGAPWELAVDVAGLAWLLDSGEGAQAIYDVLAPLAGRHLVIGLAYASAGACDRYLGQLDALLGRFDEAEEHFQAAHRLHARLGSPLFDAYTFADHARMLVRRDRHGDRERARELAEAASRTFGALGMNAHQAGVDQLLGRPTAPAPTPEPVAPPERARLSREGEYWTFEYAGRPARVRDSKGLRYLAQLLRAPGQEHHALALVLGGGAGEDGRRPRDQGRDRVAAGRGDAGPVLDAKAKADYRSRLEALREELDEATVRIDRGRAERAQEEMDFLLAELAGAVGLGGRDRRAASDSERARQSVTRAVKGAIERLAQAHPALAQHLRSTVRTGVYSAYVPDPRAPITWEG